MMTIMQTQKNFSNHLAIEFFDVSENSYADITQSIVQKFGLISAKKPSNCDDAIFHEFKQNDRDVSLEWDDWSGYVVTAKNHAAKPLAHEIAEFIYSSLKKNIFHKDNIQ